MTLQPVEPVQISEAVSSWPDVAIPAAITHEGLLHGATSTGEAARTQLSIRIGLWLDDAGWVRQARWRTTDDTALRQYGEAACVLLESGVDPLRLDADALRNAVRGAVAGDRADLVASAIHAAVFLGTGRDGA